MALTITFQLTDRDLIHLGEVVNKAKANASSLLSERRARKASAAVELGEA